MSRSVRKCFVDVPSGFTLIELITVMVILAIVGAVGSGFVASMVRSYDDVQVRSKLVSRGRLAIEQITRQIRIALPNSVRVSASGNCVEFFPIVAGSSYLSDVPDTENNAATVNSINSAPFSLGLGSVNHVVVGALDSNEIYTANIPAARANAGSLSGSEPYTAVSLAFNHRFIRNSINRRVYLAGDPLRFCVVGSELRRYTDYGLDTSALSDVPPAGSSSAIMANGVVSATSAFLLSNGTEDVNTALAIDLTFLQGSNRIRLQQQVLVRNVP